jgi:Domain of unknown function (DUF4124)
MKQHTLSSRIFSMLALALIGVASASASMSASAQLYKWTDANGKVHYSDSVPPEATDSARKEMGSDGTVRKSVDRAPTAEERRIAAQKAEEEKKARAVIEERERKDKALLATYTNLADFDRVRDRALALADAEVIALGKQSASLAARSAELTKQAEAAGKKGPPPKLANELKDVTADLASVRDIETRKTKDRVDLANLYASERIRLANLMAAQDAAKANAENKGAPAAASSNAATTQPAKLKSK